jgi:hypothetical protein
MAHARLATACKIEFAAISNQANVVDEATRAGIPSVCFGQFSTRKEAMS